MNSEKLDLCPICGRDMVMGKNVDEHHLVPKCKKGKYSGKITIHRICHEKLHSLWTEKELAEYYNTAERILEHDEIRKFVQWVSRKPSNFYAKTKMSNVRRR